MAKSLISVWETIEPVSAYVQGRKTQGMYFIPSEQHITEAVAALDSITATSEAEVAIIRSLQAALRFEEPHLAVMSAINTIYSYLVLKARSLNRICGQITEALRVNRIRLIAIDWPIEKRILCTSWCNALDGLLKEVKLSEKAKSELVKEVALYRKAFYVPGISTGVYEDVFPVLKRHSRRTVKNTYGDLLRNLYNYPQSVLQMEGMAEEWLSSELPLFKRISKKMAKVYHCRESEVNDEIVRHWRIPVKSAVSKVKQMNRNVRSIIQDYLVDIPAQHHTRIIQTPAYLAVFLPSAAVQPFATLTSKPFNLFFITPNEDTSLVDAVQLIVHEEYGHCVHYTLTSLNKRIPQTWKMDNPLHGPITEGLSFQRELEFLQLMQNDEKARSMLKGIDKSKLGEFISCLEYVTRKWRVVRFTRALYDIQIHTGKRSVPEFIEWAHQKTGISMKTIFNQTFRVGVPPGYLPGYSMLGMKLWHMQHDLKNTSLRDFNTRAASLGFPGQVIFLRELKKYVA